MRSILLASALATLSLSSALASDPFAPYHRTTSSRAPAGYQEIPAIATGYFYVGGALGIGRADLNAFLPDDTPFGGRDTAILGGAYAGYLMKMQGNLGVGVEADYMRTAFKVNGHGVSCAPPEPPLPAVFASEKLVCSNTFGKETSLWTASARARAGVFLSKELFLYGTGGPAWADGASNVGVAYGGGLELDTGKLVTIRVEVIQYNFEGGDRDQLTGRLGVALKLY
jgi:opacity protein-like surface antigen